MSASLQLVKIFTQSTAIMKGSGLKCFEWSGVKGGVNFHFSYANSIFPKFILTVVWKMLKVFTLTYKCEFGNKIRYNTSSLLPGFSREFSNAAPSNRNGIFTLYPKLESWAKLLLLLLQRNYLRHWSDFIEIILLFIHLLLF